MKALVVLAALAGTAAGFVAPARVAHADDRSFPMQRIEGPPQDRPDDSRFVPRLGQLWRFGRQVVLFDGAWWSIDATIDAGSAMGGKVTEVERERWRIDVRVRDGRVSFDIAVAGRRRLCHGGARTTVCDDWEQASTELVCWRADAPVCAF
jgi:hypothetical protein